jgi:hypothetical protein
MQVINQTTEHSRDFFQHGLQLFVVLCCQQLSAGGQFHQRNTFLKGPSCDSEEVAAVWFGKTSVPFGDVGGDGKRCSV